MCRLDYVAPEVMATARERLRGGEAHALLDRQDLGGLAGDDSGRGRHVRRSSRGSLRRTPIRIMSVVVSATLPSMDVGSDC